MIANDQQEGPQYWSMMAIVILQLNYLQARHNRETRIMQVDWVYNILLSASAIIILYAQTQMHVMQLFAISN